MERAYVKYFFYGNKNLYIFCLHFLAVIKAKESQVRKQAIYLSLFCSG